MNRFAAFFLSAIFACLPVSTVLAAPPSPFQDAQLLDPAGRPASLANYSGKPMVVNFWARWCPPCRAEIPELSTFAAQYRGRIEVIGIGLEKDPAAVSDFIREHRMRYPVLLAGDAGYGLMRELGNPHGSLPFTLLIDAEGRIIGRKVGLLRKSDLETAAEKLRPR